MDPNTKVDALYLRGRSISVGYDKFAGSNATLLRRTPGSTRTALSRFAHHQRHAPIKKQLAQQSRTCAFKLTAMGEKYVTAVGKGVLILRPSILNLDVAAPQTMNSGSDTLTFNAGQATLVLEVFDSVSSQLLARIIDTEVAGQSSIMISRNSMSNRADANALLKSWADRFGTASAKRPRHREESRRSQVLIRLLARHAASQGPLLLIASDESGRGFRVGPASW